MDGQTDEGLTLKQKAFVEHFTSPETFGNGLRAAEKAGYKGTYSTLGVTAHDNLKNPKVQLAIQKRAKGIMDANECLTELSDLARSKPSKNGDVTTKDKIRSLELVGKAHNLFGENNQQNQLQEVANIIQSLANFGINPDAVAGRVADEIERRELEARTVDMPEVE